MEAVVSWQSLPPGYVSPELRRLTEAVHEFVALGAESLMQAPSVRLHQAVGAMHRVCALVAEAEEAGVSRAELDVAVAPARELQSASPFVRRLQTWPRGYPGDFETIGYLMLQANQAPAGDFSHAVEQYALGSAVAQQHRNKVAHQARLLGEVALEGLRSGERRRILVLACGAAPDVVQVAELLSLAHCHVVLNDLDPDALARCAEQLGSRLSGLVSYVQGNVLAKLSTLASEGPYDLVVAGGLFDYLTDRQVCIVLAAAKRKLLTPSARLFFTNIASGNPYRVWLEYFANWYLIERDEQAILALAEEVGFSPQGMRVERDGTGLAVLATLTA